MLKPLPVSAPDGAKNDPVLVAFHEGNHVYSLRGPMSPGSIRDQMVRACLLIDNLHSWGILPSSSPQEYNSVAVIGTGAAGLSTALRAAQKGIGVTLFDGSSTGGVPIYEIKQPQLGCKFRYVSPTMYDWPVAHFDEPRIPWGIGGNIPLPYEGDIANTVAQNWNRKLTAELVHRADYLFEALGKEVEILTDTDGLPLRDPASDRITVQEVSTGVQLGQFLVVIDCRGGAAEDVDLPLHDVMGYAGKPIDTLRGYPFWGWRDPTPPSARVSDALESMEFALSDAHEARILICGGGDGALQDFTRAIFYPQTRLTEVYKQFEDDEDTGQYLYTLSQKFHAEERQEHRALKWLHTDLKHESQIRLSVHNRYEAWVNEFLLNQTVKEAVFRILREYTRTELPECLHIAHKYSAFSQCYPLNHFFALLLKDYVRTLGCDVKILFDKNVEYVVGPPCFSLNPGDYVGKNYDVYASSHEYIGRYNIVIPRKGSVITSSRPPFIPFRTRQMFPYQMPY